jgi:hypothetical protein
VLHGEFLHESKTTTKCKALIKITAKKTKTSAPAEAVAAAKQRKTVDHCQYFAGIRASFRYFGFRFPD